MRFLIDANLSPELAIALGRAGHDAVHVGEAVSLDATDADIFDHGLAEGRVIVSADTDFGELLARRGTTMPSVVLFRRHTRRRAREQAVLLLTHLVRVEDDLERGAVVVIEETRLRVRRLPIGGDANT